MALPINIEDLLNIRKVESTRIEFKAGWNPDKIFHTICAFATDFENIGGGYILVGVEQDNNGVAKRPVKGLPIESIDKIMKDMVNFEAKISPAYMSKVSVEEVDGNFILAIWVPAGINRPYCVSESVVAKKSIQKFYVRSKASTIEARGEILDQVRELANRIPFDERGNESIKEADISAVRVYEHLKSINSKLIEQFGSKTLMEILDAMDLLTGPTENRLIKNVAVMMFCEHPEKFFPVTQVDIVLFPEGSIENPDVMIEIPKIIGTVPHMIRETLSYLRTNVIKQRISKPTDSERSNKSFNYPYQAFEEAVVNALYHRDYQEREPVEITIEPTHIDILSYAGPDRSISNEAIKEAKKLKARRYRNRRLGDFLKELDLTEGRATGIPTIQKALKDNGSGPATIETDDDRTYFLITIPCREDMIQSLSSHKELTDSTLFDDDSRLYDSELGQIAIKVLNLMNQSVDTANIKRLIQVVVKVLSANNQHTTTKCCLKLLQVVVKAINYAWAHYRSKDAILALIENLCSVIACLYPDHDYTLKQLLMHSEMDKDFELRRKIIEPLLALGYIAKTNPDKPTSSKQSYRLTEIGRKTFID